LRSFLAKLFGYGLTGGIAAGVDVGVFAALIHGNETIVVAGTTSFCFAAIVNYFLSSRFVFRTKMSPAGFVRFFCGALVGLVVNVGLTIGTRLLFGVPPVLGKVIGIGVAFSVNFAINWLFVFQSNEIVANEIVGGSTERV